nr:hypothetical protein [uncultured bacterium]
MTAPAVPIKGPLSGPPAPPHAPQASPPSETAPGGTLLLSLILGAAPALALAIAVARGGSSNPWVLPLAGITFIVNAMIVLMDIKNGLALFIITAGLSPKLPGVYDNLRVEDFIFVMVFGVWLARNLQGRGLPRITSPIVVPFVALTLYSIFATVWGSGNGMIEDLKYSFFLQAKRIEYFLIFWVVATTVRSEAWLRLLILCFVGSGALASVYGMANPAAATEGVAETRVVGAEGENYNTLAGYLIICIGVGLAAMAGFRRFQRTFIIGCTLLSLLAVLFSFSREGYIMLLGTLGVFGFTKNRSILVVAVLLLLAIGAVVPTVRDNVVDTVGVIQRAPDDDPGSNSLTNRFRSWEYRWNYWFLKQPLVGCGVGSVALSVDSEYVLRLCEVGVVGFGIFLWWLGSIWKQVRHLRRVKGMPSVLAVGLAAAFVGMLIQAIVAASFNSIRTMEPFWFLLGLVSAAVAIQYRATQAGSAQGTSAPSPSAPAAPVQTATACVS